MSPVLSPAILPVSAAWVAAHPELLRIDVRDGHELDGPPGTLPGSHHLALSRIDEARRLGIWRRIVLISNEGARASSAADRLADLGLRRLYVLDGGLQAWRRLRLPLQQGVWLPEPPFEGPT